MILNLEHECEMIAKLLFSLSLVELCADDEVVDGHLRLVPVPVLQLYQQLLRFRECDVVPVQKSNPVVLVKKRVLLLKI